MKMKSLNLMTMILMMNDAVVITAAGSSQRFGEKKEYLSFDTDTHISVLSQCAYVFAQTGLFTHMVITIPKGDREKVLALLTADERIMPLTASVSLSIIEGGATRQDSVRCGLEKLAAVMSNDSYVLIHDGARPWVAYDVIRAVLTGAKKYGAVIPVIPVTDTQKEIDSDGKIVHHLKRKQLAAAQTPQAFLFYNLLAAHHCAQESGETYTDDSEIYAAYCAPVYTCQGMRSNKKITYPEDMANIPHH